MWNAAIKTLQNNVNKHGPNCKQLDTSFKRNIRNTLLLYLSMVCTRNNYAHTKGQPSIITSIILACIQEISMVSNFTDTGII
jgi:hypothetical protein